MFAKIFEQIFDSSIAEDWKTRIVFEDLLILADPNGVVDKTHEALSRRTNVPLDIIRESIAKLEAPDPSSRRPDNEGRRIIRLDDHRDWGWIIVNYEYYRGLASEEQRRAKTRERVRKFRSKQSCNASVTEANDSPSASSSTSKSKEVDFWDELKSIYDYIDLDLERKKMQAWLLTPRAKGRKLTKRFVVNWLNKIDKPISTGIENKARLEI